MLVADIPALAPSGSDYVASTVSTNCHNQGTPSQIMRWTNLGSLNYGSLAGVKGLLHVKESLGVGLRFPYGYSVLSTA